MVFKQAVKAIPTTKSISSFVTDSGVDAAKFLVPTFIGSRIFGTIGGAVGAVGGASLMKNKTAGATLLVLTAIDLIEMFALGGAEISRA